MTDTKPKALWLAEKLPKYFNANLATSRDIDQVAAELRRLHEVNQELVKALKMIKLYAFDTLTNHKNDSLHDIQEMGEIAHLAIAKATGEQA